VKRFLLACTVVALSVVAVLPVGSLSPIEPQQSVSIHLTLGNPSGATTRTSNSNNFLMVKPQYVLSYNNSKGGPNWVSWHLEFQDLGNQPRTNDYRADDALPDNFTHVRYSDYALTGFEAGHLCNSEDRTTDRPNNSATFLMTNMLPQAQALNGGPWRSVERFGQNEARAGRELYIIAGAFGTGGTGERGRRTSIAGGKVNVPKTFWKVLLILPRGNNDLRRINANTRTIAICMPNSQSIRGRNWRTFITTVRNVETATGYDFLSELPQATQDALETRRDSMATSRANANPCR
jgi:endonuclease G, mitochondrial